MFLSSKQGRKLIQIAPSISEVQVQVNETHIFNGGLTKQSTKILIKTTGMQLQVSILSRMLGFLQCVSSTL